MNTLSDYDYDIPKELIAQEPLKNRSDARLLVVGDTIEHKHVHDLLFILEKDDVLVLNNSKVIPARLMGKKETGGRIEVLLVTQQRKNVWTCFVKGRIKPNTKIVFEKGYGILVLGQPYAITLFGVSPQDIGCMPTPPYIKKLLKDPQQYNTVFAKEEGSVAAPTAGLHFTQELLEHLRQKGVKIVFVTLHIGPGTFLPVKSEDITKHVMHEEYYTIPEETANTINARKKRLFVVGTTTLRALESAIDEQGIVHATTGSTRLFVYPPYHWKLSFDALMTNFHVPKSTLLMLVAAIMGRERLFEVYREAVKDCYRFFSFGDAMLVYQKHLFPPFTEG